VSNVNINNGTISASTRSQIIRKMRLHKWKYQRSLDLRTVTAVRRQKDQNVGQVGLIAKNFDM